MENKFRSRPYWAILRSNTLAWRQTSPLTSNNDTVILTNTVIPTKSQNHIGISLDSWITIDSLNSLWKNKQWNNSTPS